MRSDSGNFHSTIFYLGICYGPPLSRMPIESRVFSYLVGGCKNGAGPIHESFMESIELENLGELERQIRFKVPDDE